MSQGGKLELSADIVEKVRRRLNGLEEDWGEQPTDVLNIARRLRALPVLLDMGGFYGLREDGTVIAVGWDSSAGEERTTSLRERDLALLAGSERYQFLRPLLPVRSTSDRKCLVCDGTGIEPNAAAAGLTNVRCWCGGLGWVPEYWQEPQPGED